MISAIAHVLATHELALNAVDLLQDFLLEKSYKYLKQSDEVDAVIKSRLIRNISVSTSDALQTELLNQLLDEDLKVKVASLESNEVDDSRLFCPFQECEQLAMRTVSLADCKNFVMGKFSTSAVDYAKSPPDE